jgi:zinc protease
MRSTIVGKVYSTVESIISSVMNERLQEIASKPDAPFVGAGVGIYDMTETMEALLGQVNSKDDAPIPAFKALMTEFYRMKRYGFTEAEIQRAKDNLLASYETASKNADTRSNSDFVSPLIYNFFDNESYMDPATEYELMKQVLPAITSDMINQAAEAYVTDSNFVVVHEAPEKEGLSHPTAQDFLDALAEVKAADIEAPAEEVSNAEFLDASKLKGSKIKKTYSGPYGSTVIELKNGVTVYMMPFDKEKDNISFTVLKDGGTSIVPEEDLPAFEDNILTIYDSNSGVSTFTQTEVQKMLTGKMLSVGAFCEKLRHGVRGSSTKKDIETALQLAYLYYTSYRFDQDAWNVSMNTINSVLPNLAKQPSYVLQKEIRKTLYPGHEGRHLFLDENVVAKANLGQLERNYKRLFADAAGMRAIFVGDFSVDTLAPLVAKYLGSIPKGKKALNWADNNDLIVPGARTNDFATDMQTPQTTVVDVYSAPVEYSVKAEVALDAASYIMDMRYTTSLREEEGGTYGAQTYSSMDDLPRNQAEFEVIYNCKPSMTEKLREIAEKELRDLAADGPTAEEFDMTVKNFQKRIPERRVKVSYWLECLRAYVTRNGRIFDKEYEEAVNSLTPQDIQNTLTELLDSGNHVSVIQRPQNSTEAE